MAEAETNIKEIEVTKGKGTVEIDLNKLPIEIYEACLLAGVKEYVNKRMTKITRKDIPEAKDREESAMVIAMENVEMLYAGDLTTKRKAKATKTKTSRQVMTEARRIAKQMVKDMLKAEGVKLRTVDTKEITAIANQYIDADPDIIALAVRNVAEAEAANEKAKTSSDTLKKLAAGIKINPAKKAKADKEAAEKKAEKILSAKQAGMVAVRSKPLPAPVARH